MLPSSCKEHSQLTCRHAQRRIISLLISKRTCSRGAMELSSLAAEERRGRVIVAATEGADAGDNSERYDQ
jgi:hypothetical protein